VEQFSAKELRTCSGDLQLVLAAADVFTWFWHNDEPFGLIIAGDDEFNKSSRPRPRETMTVP